MKKLLSLFLSLIFCVCAVVLPFKGMSETSPPNETDSTIFTDEDSTQGMPIAKLLHSEQIGGWDDKYEQYNCYAYALGREKGTPYPGWFSGVTTNEFERVFRSTDHSKLKTLADYIEADLKSDILRYNCVQQKTTDGPPTSSLASDQSMIVFRIGSKDFHFMRYMPTEKSWYHKPGASIILKYLENMRIANAWTNERVLSDGIHVADRSYNSTFYYFIFSKNHLEKATDYNSSQHKLTCSRCGEVRYEAHISNSTGTQCKICGRKAPFTTPNSVVTPNSSAKDDKQSSRGILK